MNINIQIVSGLAPEDLVTVQMGLINGSQYVKTIKGDESDLLPQSGRKGSVPKHAVISHDFPVTKQSELQILIAWPKQRNFVQWNFNSEDYGTAESKTESEKNSYKHFVLIDGIFYFDDDKKQKKMIAGWKKLGNLEEIRDASGKIIEINCSPMPD